MAAGKYTLLDLATRSGAGVTSLIEGVLTYAPELMIVPTFPKAGITYTTLTRSALPAGDFRAVGGGVPLQRSEWKRETGSMALFEAQMQIAEDIVIAAKAENSDLITGDILADEAIATLRGSVIRICSQFWYGTSIGASGFQGLSTQVDTTNNEVNAGGAGGANSNSVYLVYLDDNVVNPQGIHFFLGNGGRMNMADQWIKQQLATTDTPAKYFMAFVNNFISYLGLVLERPEALYRAKNVTTAFPFTDGVAAQVLAKVPLALRADKTKFRWFMNAQALYTLQASRATVTVATPGSTGVAKGGVFPDMPESCLGIQIQPTDSLRISDRAGLFN